MSVPRLFQTQTPCQDRLGSTRSLSPGIRASRPAKSGGGTRGGSFRQIQRQSLRYGCTFYRAGQMMLNRHQKRQDKYQLRVAAYDPTCVTCCPIHPSNQGGNCVHWKRCAVGSHDDLRMKDPDVPTSVTLLCLCRSAREISAVVTGRHTSIGRHPLDLSSRPASVALC